DMGLASELAFSADLARDTRDLIGEGIELVDHRVDRVLQLEDLASNVDRDLLRQVAVGHGGRDVGDVADLAREVAGHEVDVVGEVLPHTADSLHLRLTAETTFGADLAGDTGHLV